MQKRVQRERRHNAAKTSNGKGAQQRRRQAPQKHQVGKGLNRGDDKRPKASSGKGAQSAGYAKRWSMKGIDKAQRFS
jgi:hypothetical protein